MIPVNFDIDGLSDEAIQLFITASGGSGWVAGIAEAERHRRERARAGEFVEPPTLALPDMDPVSLRAEFLEAGKCLIALQVRWLELCAVDPDSARALESAVHLFSAIMLSIRIAAAQSDAAVN